jgi:hypothetical protein
MRSERSMPLITCEMRWLLDGPLPGGVERWFQSGAEPGAAARREDRYLLLPGVADMGIKEREGRLEVKGRLAVLGTHAIAAEIEGRAERWCKWTYGTAVAEGFRHHGAIIVGKGRVQKHFLLEPGGLAQATTQRDLSRRGFSLELTRIWVPSGDHWSLGVEATPDDPTLLADLLRTLGDLLQGFPISLPRARSRSYPAWLARLKPDAGFARPKRR